MSSEKHYCTNCKDRIFRRGFNIDGRLYCKHCIYTLFGVRFKDSEYIVSRENEAKLKESE